MTLYLYIYIYKCTVNTRASIRMSEVHILFLLESDARLTPSQLRQIYPYTEICGYGVEECIYN